MDEITSDYAECRRELAESLETIERQRIQTGLLHDATIILRRAWSQGVQEREAAVQRAGKLIEESAIEGEAGSVLRPSKALVPERRAAAEAGQIRDAYRSFVVNECIGAGIPESELPLETPFNVLVRRLIDKRVARALIDARVEPKPNRLRRAVQLIVSAQVDLDAMNAGGEFPRSFHVGPILRSLDQTIMRIEQAATELQLCEACGGLGTPPGEAAGLVCGACNGTGERNNEEPD